MSPDCSRLLYKPPLSRSQSLDPEDMTGNLKLTLHNHLFFRKIAVFPFPSSSGNIVNLLTGKKTNLSLSLTSSSLYGKSDKPLSRGESKTTGNCW